MLGGTAAGLVDATTGEGIHEAASTGRFAAEAVAARRRGALIKPAVHFDRAAKRAFYGRLRHRHKLMTFLERRPARFDVLFGQLERHAEVRATAAARSQRLHDPASGSISTAKRSRFR